MKRVVPGIAIVALMLTLVGRHACAQGETSVSGVVRDGHGTPQMGALVELLAPDTSVVAHTFTDDRGHYLLRSIAPGRYDLRASAAFLLPSVHNHVRLAPGSRALENLTMTAMFELGTWFPTQRRSQNEPADDWRWTLRSSADRPLLRMTGTGGAGSNLPGGVSAVPEVRGAYALHGNFELSSDNGRFAGGGEHQILSADRVQSGSSSEVVQLNVGEPLAGDGASSLSVRAGYERHSPLGGEGRMVLGLDNLPEIAAGGQSGLQAVTLATTERFAFGDAVLIDAGTLLSAERLAADRVISEPYLRLVVTPADGLAIMYRYAAGHTVQGSDDLDSLELLPTLLAGVGGRPVSAQGNHQELAVAQNAGKSTVSVSVYQDNLPVVALQGEGILTVSEQQALPVLADDATGTFHLSGPGYVARGFSATYKQELRPGLKACVQADFGTALEHAGELQVSDVNSALHTSFVPSFTGSLRGSVARSGTSYRVQYRWQPASTLTAVNSFNAPDDEAYLTVSLRQRLWSGRRLRGMDAILEATNLLEEGYEPMVGPDGQTLFLAQVPRALEAGLAFSF